MSKGLTLAEKRNGPGYRDRLLTKAVRIVPRCAVPSCWARTEVILTLYVDAYPPGRGWYEELLRLLPIGAETEVGLCWAHSADVIHAELDWADDPARWEPGRLNPPVMPGPGR